MLIEIGTSKCSVSAFAMTFGVRLGWETPSSSLSAAK
jgi:hypothetical protein